MISIHPIQFFTFYYLDFSTGKESLIGDGDDFAVWFPLNFSIIAHNNYM